MTVGCLTSVEVNKGKLPIFIVRQHASTINIHDAQEWEGPRVLQTPLRLLGAHTVTWYTWKCF